MIEKFKSRRSGRLSDFYVGERSSFYLNSNIMSKIILLALAGFLVGAFILSAPMASAAEIPVNQINASISKEEVVILQQSLLALTMVLTDLNAMLAKSENLPQNTDKIIANLSNISKSLVQISATMEKKGLAVEMPKIAIPQAPLVVVQKTNEKITEDSIETAILESSQFESENQLETLLGESEVETESQRTFMASIGAIAGQKITWIIIVILAIGGVLFWKMRGGQEVAKA